MFIKLNCLYPGCVVGWFSGSSHWLHAELQMVLYKMMVIKASRSHMPAFLLPKADQLLVPLNLPFPVVP